MANEIQKSIVGTVAAAAAGVHGIKDTFDKAESKQKSLLEKEESKKQKQEQQQIQSAREEELYKLQVKGLKAENREKRLKARTAKVELELATAKARDSLEAARIQTQSKSYKGKIQERLAARKAVK